MDYTKDPIEYAKRLAEKIRNAPKLGHLAADLDDLQDRYRHTKYASGILEDAMDAIARRIEEGQYERAESVRSLASKEAE
ncbi:MAG: hypothetical protein WC069_06560 [Candidatus Shapirobacteria bacterium]